MFRALAHDGLFLHLVKDATLPESQRAIRGFSVYEDGEYGYEVGDARELFRRHGSRLGVTTLAELFLRLRLEAGAAIGVIHLGRLTELERPVTLEELRANGVAFAPNIVSGSYAEPWRGGDRLGVGRTWHARVARLGGGRRLRPIVTAPKRPATASCLTSGVNASNWLLGVHAAERSPSLRRVHTTCVVPGQGSRQTRSDAGRRQPSAEHQFVPAGGVECEPRDVRGEQPGNAPAEKDPAVG